MNTIVKQPDELFTKSARTIGKAMQGDLIKTLDEDSLHLLVQGTQREALTIMGQGKNMSPDEGRALEIELKSFLLESCEDLTAAEVRLAIIRGARGLYQTGEVAYSVRSACSWIAAYREQKRDAIREFQTKKTMLSHANQELTRMTRTEKTEQLDSFFQSWKEWGNRAVFGGYCNHYRLAKEMGAFTGKHTVAQLWSIVDEACKLHADHIAESRKDYQPASIIKLQRRDLDFVASMDRKKRPEGIPASIAARCQEVTLRRWFQDLAADDIKPSDLLKSTDEQPQV